MSTPFIRQLLVVSAVQLVAVSVGGTIGYPNTLLQQLQRNDSSIQLDLESSSWLGSIHGFTGVPSILMPSLMQWKGRKIAFLISCLLVAIGWITAYTAQSITTILISESLHGFGSECVMLVSFCGMSEMVSPKFRSMSVGFYTISQSIGIAISSILGQYCHWRTVPLVMIIPMTLGILIAWFIWPESPSWLALQGRYEECRATFKWLRGEGRAAKMELSGLLQAKKEVVEKETFFKSLTRRDFYVPAILMILLFFGVYWSGTMVLLVFSPVMIQRMTSDNDTMKYSLIVYNVVLILGYINSTTLMRRINNKTMILIGATGVVITTLFCSLLTLLQSLGVFSGSIPCVIALILYAFVIVGFLVPPSYALAMEITAVKHRGIGGALYVVTTCLLHFSSLKAAPYMFEYLKLWGALLVYCVNAAICGLLTWKFVPETKYRTLQELEDYFNHGKFIKRCDDDVETPMVASSRQ